MSNWKFEGRLCHCICILGVWRFANITVSIGIGVSAIIASSVLANLLVRCGCWKYSILVNDTFSRTYEVYRPSSSRNIAGTTVTRSARNNICFDCLRSDL